MYKKRGITYGRITKRFRRVIAETKISSIIDSQLTYAGYDIDDLAENALFEEVVFYYGIIDCLLKMN